MHPPLRLLPDRHRQARSPSTATSRVGSPQCVQAMGLRYATITGVARDDLPDGGAWLYAETVRQIHAVNPDTGVELLAPDFNAVPRAARRGVRLSRPEVFAHNVETVPRIFKRIRPGFRYERSLDVHPRRARRRPGHQVQPDPRHGRDARRDQRRRCSDLHDAGCELITITQYLRPSPQAPPGRPLGQARGVRRAAGGGRADRLRRRDERAAGSLVLPRRAALPAGDLGPRRRRPDPDRMATSAGHAQARASPPGPRRRRRAARSGQLGATPGATSGRRSPSPGSTTRRFLPYLAMFAVARRGRRST